MAASRTTAATDPTDPPVPPLVAGVLIYDGDCGFCTASARWIESRLSGGATIAPWQALDLGALGLTEADVTSAAYWADESGTHRGADAIAAALRSCRGVWRAAGVAISHPPLLWLARAVYPLVARNRHRLPGSTTECEL